MSRTEDVVNSVWDDLDDLSNDAMMLWLWSYTNPRCGMAGIYTVPRRKLAEGRLDGASLQVALEELEAADLVYYRERVLWCKPRVRQLRSKTPQIAKSIAKDLRLVESSELYLAFIEEHAEGETRTWLEPHVRFTDGSGEARNQPSSPESGEPQPRFQGPGPGPGPGGVTEEEELTPEERRTLEELLSTETAADTSTPTGSRPSTLRRVDGSAVAQRIGGQR